MAARKCILMYHSIYGPGMDAAIGSKPISLERFAHQVESAVQAGWQFGRLSQVHQPVEHDTLYITGDDGSSDWANTALPWCESRDIPTHTAIVTGPWRDQPIYPLAHVVQVLLACREVGQLTAMREAALEKLTEDERAYAQRIYAYETDDNRRMIKGAMSLVLDEAGAWQIIGRLSDAERASLSERFAPARAYRRFKAAEFGTHTVSHNAMDGNAERYLTEEIEPARATLVEQGLGDSRVFTLPMAPRHGARAEHLIEPLRNGGYIGMLHGSGWWDGESFTIPRIDAKNVERELGLPMFEPGVVDGR